MWNFSGQQVRDLNGRAYPGAKAYFYDSGTTTDRSVYQDGALTTRHSQPVVADAQGRFPAVYVTVGLYRFRIVTAQDVSIGVDFDEVTGGVTETDPSGSVDVNTVFQTGWPLFIEKTGTLAGFVRDNARTIGSAASGATERANADVAALYAFYWDTFPNGICPVVSGRGASAAADFASNKAIATLDKRGRGVVGLDDMGNLAANVIQASTTITTTNGSPIITLVNQANVTLGMYVTSTNVPAGAYVTAISYGASTCTLNVNATATASGTAARFSLFVDAHVPGRPGGSDVHYLLAEELPIITPAGTISVTQGTVAAPFNTAAGAAAGTGDVWAGTGPNFPTVGVAATFAGSPLGSGHPFPLMPPGILGTWYRKI